MELWGKKNSSIESCIYFSARSGLNEELSSLHDGGARKGATMTSPRAGITPRRMRDTMRIERSDKTPTATQDEQLRDDVQSTYIVSKTRLTRSLCLILALFVWLCTIFIFNQSMNQSSSYSTNIPGKARLSCVTAKSMKQLRNINRPLGVLVSMAERPSQRNVSWDVSCR